MTERLHFHFSLSCIGEGNGNPLQCSCLENPRDRGAWWAAVYGPAQSRTQLKRLSSSSSSSSTLTSSTMLLTSPSDFLMALCMSHTHPADEKGSLECVFSPVWLCSLMDCNLPGSLSMEFPRQEYWSGLLFLTPGDLPNAEIQPTSLASPASKVNSLPLNHLGSPKKETLMHTKTGPELHPLSWLKFSKTCLDLGGKSLAIEVIGGL